MAFGGGDEHIVDAEAVAESLSHRARRSSSSTSVGFGRWRFVSFMLGNVYGYIRSISENFRRKLVFFLRSQSFNDFSRMDKHRLTHIRQSLR